MAVSDIHILVVDDDSTIRTGAAQVLESDGYYVEAVPDAETAQKLIERHNYEIVLLDLRLPGKSGKDFLADIKSANADTEVIIITGHASLESAVESMRDGAFDYIPKPFTAEHLRVVVNRAVERLTLSLRSELYERGHRTISSAKFVIGESKIFREIYRIINKVGPTDCTMLVTGESGTGKELAAREIHRHSNRRHMPFITVDCGTVVETLFESELFGHEKGAFTGATETTRGWFQLADGGTIFLDEISNISTNIQAKLLRAIQEKEIKPVGGNRVIKVDVRIIAATNRVLEEEVTKGRFREDLYYRLSVFPVLLPPLRERREDIIHLANYFVRKFSRLNRRHIVGISDEAMDMLIDYKWPGNIRELENVIERAAIIEEDIVITPKSISIFADKVSRNEPADIMAKGFTLNELEKNYILQVLKKCGWKKSEAAKILGIDRKSLYNRIEKYGLTG